ncbi:MAG: helix-turn-helix transcriptional regulator [Rhodobacteraceae bacterium]|nr:helix-turn-helix transcriptional regulator [Paracoccaceae bacterium]
MTRRGYNEGCLAAHALDLIGDRWAILVLRELMLGPKRFGMIKAGMPGIATNVLTQRLADLEAGGLLERRLLPPPAAVAVYALTPGGLGTRPIIDALCRWGVEQPGHDPRKFISPTGLMLSMSVMVRPAETVEDAAFTMGDESFTARLGPEGFTSTPGPGTEVPLRFEGSANALAAAVYGPAPLAAHLQAGNVRLIGDAARAQRFIDHFLLRRGTALAPGVAG